MPLPKFQFPPPSWPGGRYSLLLASLLFSLGIDPLVHGFLIGRILVDAAFVLIFLLVVLAEGAQRWAVIFAVLMVILGVIVMYIDHGPGTQMLPGQHAIETLRIVGSIVFFAYGASVILHDLIRGREATLDKISGAVCVYLLLGLMWAYAYLLVESHVPGSFHFTDEELAASFAEVSRSRFRVIIYFSFSSLTTMGYGDITPATYLTRTLAWMEAVTGQLFLAIFIAGLVGTHFSNWNVKR